MEVFSPPPGHVLLPPWIPRCRAHAQAHRIPLRENFPGAGLSPDEVEFALAMERYMRLQNRRFPTWHEVLRVAHALGYRKPDVVRVRPERPESE